MSPPRVLLLIKGLGAGGAEQLLVNSIPYLDRTRFDYEVAYFLPTKNDHVASFERAGIPVTCLGTRTQLDPRVIRRLADFIEARRFDVLDVHLPYPGVVSRLAARTPRRPALMYTEHSLSVQRRLSHGRIVAFAMNVATYGRNDHVVAVSEDTGRDVRRFTRRRVPLTIVRNGIPLDEFRRDPARERAARGDLGVPDDAVVVGHVAKMVSKKRQFDLLEAAQLVLRERPDVHFVMAGQGPLRARLEERATALGIAGNVHFAGFVDDIVATMAAFDIFVLTSMHEGLPTVTIESLALGVPVVATRVGGTPEVVDHGVSGILVPPRRPRQVADAIRRLVDDEALRTQMGARGAEIVRERFSIRRRVACIEALYADLLDDRSVAR